MKEVSGQSKARAHHYLSQCYLKEFSELKKQFLTQIDINERRILPPSNTKNIAQERDFNRVDLKDIEPNFLENTLGEAFEGNVATALRNIENENMFEGEDRSFILNLITLFAIRNPTRRMQYGKMIEQKTKIALSIAANQIGKKVNGIEITEDFKRVVEEDRFNIILSRNQHIRTELSIFNELLPHFFYRKWTLVRAPSGAHFITSDFPVVLFWSDGLEHNISPGFGLRGTQVHFALSKKLALIGSFDDFDGNVMAEKHTVALINSNILEHAKRWVYAPSHDFYFLGKSSELLHGIRSYWSFLDELSDINAQRKN